MVDEKKGRERGKTQFLLFTFILLCTIIIPFAMYLYTLYISKCLLEPEVVPDLHISSCSSSSISTWANDGKRFECAG